MDVGSIIKRYRLSKGMTQEELGKAIGVSKQAIQKYEKNESGISNDKVEKIAKFFNVSPAVIMGWDNNDDEITTIAAHKNDPNAEWTEEELKEIEEFKEFVKMKRRSKK